MASRAQPLKMGLKQIQGLKDGVDDKDAVNVGQLKYLGVTPLLYGAEGDGTTDDTVAVQAAIDSGFSVIDGGGLTYLVSDELTGRAGLTLRNITLQWNTLASNGIGMLFEGTAGTEQTLASDYAEGVFGMTVTTGSAFAEHGWAFLKSDEYWSHPSGDNVKYGELVEISDISGNTLTFGTSTLLKYETASTAKIVPLTMLESVTFENVTFIGPESTGNQVGVKFIYCTDVNLYNFKSYNFDYVHVFFQTSSRCRVYGGIAEATGTQEGLDYGVTVNDGCYDIVVDGYVGNDLRHVTAIGGSQGVSRHIKTVNCHGYNITDGGLDSHSPCYEYTADNNTIHYSDNADVTMDGIACAAGMATITNNKFYNSKRHGILWNPEALNEFSGPIAAVISGNQAYQQRNTGSSSAVAVSTFTVVSGTAQAGAASTITLAAGSSSSNDVYNLRKLVTTGGTGSGQTVTITDYVGSTKVATIDPAWGVVPDATTTYTIYVDAAPITSCNIANNQGGGYSNMVILQPGSSEIRNASLVANNCMSAMRSRGVYVDVDYADVDGLEIIGGHYEVDNSSSNPVIDLVGANGGRVKNWRIIAPHLKRGASGTGIRIINTDDGTEYGTTIDGVTTKFSIDSASTGHSFDRTKSGITTYSAGTAYTVTAMDKTVIVNRAATVTLTLPDATTCLGRQIRVKTIQAQQVDSASSNVVPIDSATAGTAIVPNTDGAWALLESDGTNWIIIAKGP